MTVEVCVNVDRNVLLAGESLQCLIKIVNKGSKKETVAWLSAQLLCKCTYNHTRVIMPKNSSYAVADFAKASGGQTSFIPEYGELGVTVWATIPKILACEFQLNPNTCQIVQYNDFIPFTAPPTYRGHSLKYSYKLIIGVSKLGDSAEIIKIPFRVFVLYELEHYAKYDPNDASNQPLYKNGIQFSSTKQVSISDGKNGLGIIEKRRILQDALDFLHLATAKKMSCYNISVDGMSIGRLSMTRQAFRIGDEICGTVDFSDSSVTCVQVVMSVETDELISEECRCAGSHPNSHVETHASHKEYVLNTTKTYFALSIPLSQTPQFITDIASLRWKLKFEFFYTRDPIQLLESAVDPAVETTVKAPGHASIESITWEMNIKVLPANPLHAIYAPLLAPNVMSTVI